MGLRETLNEQPKVIGGVVAFVLLAGAAYAVSKMWGSEGGVAPTVVSVFYTVDEGETWFKGDASQLVPFEKDGKQVVRAHVAKCGSGEPFVQYIERYKPEAKAMLESLNKPDPTRQGPPNIGAIREASVAGRELKRPGDKTWTSSGDFRAAGAITTAKCPDGSEPNEVEP